MRSLDHQTGAPPPQRFTTRVLLDFITAVIARSARSVNGHLGHGLTLSAIQHANVEHLSRDPHTSWAYAYVAPPDSERRPISVHALAETLSSSPETTRRHVDALVAAGLCVRLPGQGVIVPAGHFDTPSTTEQRGHLVTRFASLISELRRVSFPLEARRPNAEPFRARLSDSPPPEFLIGRGVTHFVLRVILDGIPVHGDYTTGVLFCMVMVENTRHFTYDPEVAWRFASAEQAPPDSLRRPAAARSIATALGMPYTTARRRLNRMVESGRLECRDGGYIVPNRAMDSPVMLANGLRIHNWFLSMLNEFSATGLDILN